MDIPENNKATVVELVYLSQPRKVKENGLKGLLGFKKEVQEEKVLTIEEEPDNVLIYVDEESDVVTIRFKDKKQYDKLSDDDFDETTLRRGYIMSYVHPYLLRFPRKNLRKIN